MPCDSTVCLSPSNLLVEEAPAVQTESSESQSKPSTDESATDSSQEKCLKEKTSSDASESEPCLKDKAQDEATQTSSDTCLKDTPESTTEDASSKSETTSQKSSKSQSASENESTENCLDENATPASTSETDTAKSQPSEDSWQVADDKILREMKDANRAPAWTEVANALGRSVQDVKARWKVIKDVPADVQSKPSKEKSTEKKGKESPKATKPTRQTSAKPQRKNTQPQSNEQPILSGEEASSEASLPSLQGQKRFLTKHIHSKLYPPRIEPVADTHFSQRDCDVLAAADSRYKHARWLEMQANFFNVTGRMVPLEIIRNKIKGAKSLERGLARLDIDEASRAKNTERWVKAQQ